MKNLRLFFAFALSLSHGLVLLAPVAALAQNTARNAPPPGGNKNPDADWAALTALVAPGGIARVSVGNKTRAEIDAAMADTAHQFRQAAQSARDFYSNFPADPRAAQAKKIEATSLLESVLPTDPAGNQPAFQVAAAYRADAANPLTDRIAVAALMEARRYYAFRLGKRLADDPAEHEATADRLRSEFGDAPEVYDYYLGVIDAADAENGHRIAQRVLQQPAPAAAKRQAQVTIDRHALLGRPINLALTAHDNRRIDLVAPGRPTILVVWSPRHGDTQWTSLKSAARTAPQNARWIYLALDATNGEAQSARRSASAAGAYCFEPVGQPSTAAPSLKLRRVPFVYVFNANGELAAYGRPTELSALLSKLTP